MFDFSTAKVRCSTIYNIMGGSDRKTNLQKWEEMCEELAKQELRAVTMQKKTGPGYAKVQETILRVKNCIEIFEQYKNDELPLSDGTKSYLSSLYGDIKYGKWNPTKDIGNKFTEKGKKGEEEAISIVCRLDKVVYVKNELTFENDFLKGTPDIIVGEDPCNAEKIVDVKCPWDCETFFANLHGEEINPTYFYQMQGYMALTNAPVAEVHFCMVDLPDYMWLRESQKLFNRMEVVTEDDIDFKIAQAQLFRNLNFGDMPLSERRIKFVIDRDEEVIQKIYRQVEKCRPYLQEIERKHLGIPKEELPLMQTDVL